MLILQQDGLIQEEQAISQMGLHAAMGFSALRAISVLLELALEAREIVLIIIPAQKILEQKIREGSA